jgi:hypothetical protein
MSGRIYDISGWASATPHARKKARRNVVENLMAIPAGSELL